MVLAATALGTGPAGAAVSTIKPAKAKTQTWIGQVQRQVAGALDRRLQDGEQVG